MRDLPRTIAGHVRRIAVPVAIVVLVGSLLPAAASGAITIQFTTPPAGATGGTPFATQPVVTVDLATPQGTMTLAIGGTTAGGTLSGCSAPAYDSGTGRYTFSGCEIDKAGTYTLIATFNSGQATVESTSFAVAVGPATALVFTTQPGSGAKYGQPFTPQPVVTITDAGGNTVTSGADAAATVSLTLLLPPAGSGGVGAKLTCNPATNQSIASAGVASFAGCSVDKTGTGYRLQASASVGSPASAVLKDSGPFAVTTTAKVLVFTTQPSVEATAGIAFPTQPVVRLEDTTGQVAYSDTGQVTMTLSGTPGTLACAPNSVTPVNGSAAFAGCAISAAGKYRLVATRSDVSSGTSDQIDVTAGSYLTFFQQPGGGAPNVAWAAQPVVAVYDSKGALVTGTEVSVSLTISTNPGGGTLSCASGNSVKTTTGYAFFGGCYITTAGTGYRLQATATGYAPATSNGFNISGSSLAFYQQPGGGPPGVAWTTQPIVTVRDGSGALVTGTSVTVTLAISNNPGGGALYCLTSGTSVTTTSGYAYFSGCYITLAGSGYTLLATASGGYTSATSVGFTIGGAYLAFYQQPGGGPPSTAWATQPVVVIKDSYGNLVTGAVTVTLAISTNPGGGILYCTGSGTSVTTTSGYAYFSGCYITLAGTGYTLLATATGYASTTSNAFTVGGAYLAFSQQPGGGSPGVAWTTQPVIAIRNSSGVLVTGTSVTVTLAISANPGGGTLYCTGTGTSVTTTTGYVYFSGCYITLAGTGYTLLATATGYASTTSNAFTIGGAGTGFVLTTSAPIPAGAQNPVIIWGQGFTLSVSFPASSATVTLQGNRNPADSNGWSAIATLTTNSSGKASFYYTPVTNLYYRASFAGGSGLPAQMSNTVRTVVRQISILRPTNSGAVKHIASGSSVTFTTTVRPSRPELTPAVVTYYFYKQVGGAWKLQTARNVTVSATYANQTGVAVTTFSFGAGEWYVRSQANPTTYNANSVMSPTERYSVG